MSERRDEFLSDEDLDLRNLSAEELETYWRLWLTPGPGHERRGPRLLFTRRVRARSIRLLKVQLFAG